MSVQQCARFCNKPQQHHAQALKQICRYLLKTHDMGLTFRPDPARGLECFVDADWAGSWQMRSSHDPISVRSRTGYVIMYAGCPIVWASKMQTLVALSTTEAEYIALCVFLSSRSHCLNESHERTHYPWFYTQQSNPETPLHCLRRQSQLHRSCDKSSLSTSHQTSLCSAPSLSLSHPGFLQFLSSTFPLNIRLLISSPNLSLGINLSTSEINSWDGAL